LPDAANWSSRPGIDTCLAARSVSDLASGVAVQCRDCTWPAGSCTVHDLSSSSCHYSSTTYLPIYPHPMPFSSLSYCTLSYLCVDLAQLPQPCRRRRVTPPTITHSQPSNPPLRASRCKLPPSATPSPRFRHSPARSVDQRRLLIGRAPLATS